MSTFEGTIEEAVQILLNKTALLEHKTARLEREAVVARLMVKLLVKRLAEVEGISQRMLEEKIVSEMLTAFDSVAAGDSSDPQGRAFRKVVQEYFGSPRMAEILDFPTRP